MRDGEETTYYIYDYSTHDDAVSKIDEDNLQKIADDMNVPYFNMYDKGESLQGKVEMMTVVPSPSAPFIPLLPP